MNLRELQTAKKQFVKWRRDPVSMVRELFGVEPDPWQFDALMAFPDNPRLGMKACKGPGKTAVLSWLAWNFLLTRPHPKVAATSITGDNLSDCLWTEMAKWRVKAPLLQKMFEWNKTRIYARQHPETWFMSARTWSKSAEPDQQADTLAGLHADYMMFVLDESGGIPDSVMVAAEAGLSTGVEVHLVQAGNPTHLEGPLYRACTSDRALWHIVQISGDPKDPRRSPRIDPVWAQQQINTWGEDNPWVQVNVFGNFPKSSLNALLGPEDCDAAMSRILRPHMYNFAPKILGVDVARFGDDSTIILPRQGLSTFKPVMMRNARTEEIASRVGLAWTRWGADACFLDGTGGWANGVCDALILNGFDPQMIMFNGKADDMKYFNKRSEMYFKGSQYVLNGGSLPLIRELKEELCAHEFTFDGDRMRVLEKDLVKQKIHRSPDHSDAYVLTFAREVAKKHKSPIGLGNEEDRVEDFDPYRNAAGGFRPTSLTGGD